MSTARQGARKSPHTSIDRARLCALMAREEAAFVPARPKSAALYERARRSLLGGVLLTPFYYMALVLPASSAADVDQHTQVFTAAVSDLVA